MLDRLGVEEELRRDAWRQAVWIVEDGAAHGREVQMIRSEEESDERRGK